MSSALVVFLLLFLKGIARGCFHDVKFVNFNIILLCFSLYIFRNKAIADYLSSNGYMNAFEHFQKESGLVSIENKILAHLFTIHPFKNKKNVFIFCCDTITMAKVLLD